MQFEIVVRWKMENSKFEIEALKKGIFVANQRI